MPAGRYDTDPISRRERGPEENLRATTLARDGGSGGNGIGNANWLSRYVRCGRHHLFGCKGAVRRARAMAGGSGLPRECAGRTLATASQVSTSSVARSPCICRGQSRPRRAATSPCPVRRARTAGGDRLKLAVLNRESVAHVCWMVNWSRRLSPAPWKMKMVGHRPVTEFGCRLASRIQSQPPSCLTAASEDSRLVYQAAPGVIFRGTIHAGCGPAHQGMKNGGAGLGWRDEALRQAFK